MIFSILAEARRILWSRVCSWSACFLRIESLSCSKFWHCVRSPYRVVRHSSGFCLIKMFCPRNQENGPKIGFFEFVEETVDKPLVKFLESRTKYQLPEVDQMQKYYLTNLYIVGELSVKNQCIYALFYNRLKFARQLVLIYFLVRGNSSDKISFVFKIFSSVICVPLLLWQYDRKMPWTHSNVLVC